MYACPRVSLSEIGALGKICRKTGSQRKGGIYIIGWVATAAFGFSARSQIRYRNNAAVPQMPMLINLAKRSMATTPVVILVVDTIQMAPRMERPARAEKIMKKT